MDRTIDWYNEQRLKRAADSLRRNNMAAYTVPDAPGLHELLSTLIRPGSSVGVGDSVTLEQTGVLDLLRSGPYEFLDKYRPGISGAEKRELYIRNFSAGTFICSANAITEDGGIFNIDGNGSRLAPTIYGPEQVIFVAGVNKLVPSLEDAVKRARQYSAPLDAKRLGKNTPCAVTGKCSDCNSPERICNSFALLRRQFVKERIKVIFVRRTLGY